MIRHGVASSRPAHEGGSADTNIEYPWIDASNKSRGHDHEEKGNTTSDKNTETTDDASQSNFLSGGSSAFVMLSLVSRKCTMISHLGYDPQEIKKFPDRPVMVQMQCSSHNRHL
jgi:hypothetical protein